ncbi:MAG: YhgE/Pip family protein [Brevibacterium yomogidense]
MAMFERADTDKRVTWLTLVGLVLVPLLIAAGFVFATWKVGDRLDEVTAAIVNEDEGAEIEGQQVPLGRQLSAGLVDADQDQNVTWVLSDEDDAAAGLSDGRYAASVTIPEGFSEAVASGTQEDPMAAQQATLDVVSSKTSPLADTVIIEAITSAAKSQFNQMWSEQYLDGVFVGFNDMGEQMREMGDAAGELATGADELDSGVGELSDGAGQLSDNSGGITEGAGALNDGVGGIADGASGLSEGAGALSDGIGQLDDGAQELAGGAGDLSDGLGELHDGVDDLPDQTQQLADGASDLDDGAGELSSGVDDYTTGIDEILSGFAGDGDDGGIQDLADGMGELEDGADQLSDGAQGVSDGLGEYQSGLEEGAAGAGGLAESTSPLTVDTLVDAGVIGSDEAAQLEGQMGQMCGQAEDPAVCEDTFLRGFTSGLAGGLGGAASGLDEQDPATGMSLADGASGVADGADELSGGIGEAQDGVAQLADGMTELSDNAPQLLEASEQLRDGASGLSDGTGELSDGVQQLADGMGPLVEGVEQSSDGAGQLADGAGAFADGVGELGDGAGQLADGAGELASGAGELGTGMDEFTVGLGQYTDGVVQLADGTTQLQDGTEQLSEGTGEFADGIEEGAEEVPSYSDAERDNLSTAVSQAIGGDEDGFSGLTQGSTIALLVIMAMWIGALITYTIVRAVPARALTSRAPSWKVLLTGLGPGLFVGLIQSVVLAILAHAVLGLPIFDFAPLLVLLLFAAVTFAVVTFALTALLGGVGRIISVAMVVLAVAGRLVGAVPGWFDAVAPFLPLTPAMNGVAALAAGAPGVGAAYGGLLGWLVLGLLGAFIAVVRGRMAGSSGLARLSRSGA